MTDSGNHRFNATLNTTDCHDGTTCPNAKNETCCANKEGVSVISFHNTGLIPSTVTALTSYYSAGGYTIPTTTPAASATGSASPTSTSTSSSSLSSGAKAGIGVGAAVGAVAVAVLAFLVFRHFQKRRSTRQTPSYENIRSTDGMIVPNYGPGKHEMVGQGVAMQDYRKHELSGQSVTPQDVKKDAVMGQPARLEMDAASPERNRFHELDVDG